MPVVGRLAHKQPPELRPVCLPRFACRNPKFFLHFLLFQKYPNLPFKEIWIETCMNFRNYKILTFSCMVIFANAFRRREVWSFLKEMNRISSKIEQVPDFLLLRFMNAFLAIEVHFGFAVSNRLPGRSVVRTTFFTLIARLGHRTKFKSNVTYSKKKCKWHTQKLVCP